MRRYGLCAGLGAVLIILGGVSLAAAQQIDKDLSGRDGSSGAMTVGPPVAWTERPDNAPMQAVQSNRRGNPLWEIPVKTLIATRDRPIFSPSRRPLPPVALAAPYIPPRLPAKPASPQLALLGTVLGAAEETGAVNAADGLGVFLDQASNTVVRLKTGDYHSGWFLRSVQGREATLQNDRDTVVLALPARGMEGAGSSYANTNTNISAVQPVRELLENVGPTFRLEQYD